MTRGAPFHVVEPFVVPLTHGRINDAAPHRLKTPLRTITAAHRGEIALIAPTLIQTGYGERKGQAPRCLNLQEPIGTIVAGGGRHALVSALLTRHFGGNANLGSDVRKPMHTVTAKDHHSLVTSHLMKFRGTCRDGQSVKKPVPTITAKGTHIAEVRAFLKKHEVGDGSGIVMVNGEAYVIVDIGMRMLAPRELYRAMGVPDSYKITPMVRCKRSKRRAKMVPLSKTGQIRMCGNMVTPHVGAALVRANIKRVRKAAA